MLYANNPKSYISNSSTLTFDRVFNGQYWDEFSLTIGSLERPRVLLLGLAAGAGIRPILAANRNTQIDAVEIDKEFIRTSQDIYNHNFPDLKFNTIESCALTHLKKVNLYNSIWVDIYESTQYSPLLFKNEFWHYVKKNIDSSGEVYLNVYGLPNHLESKDLNSPLNSILSIVSAFFENIRIIPYRRNATLILSNKKTKEKDPSDLCENLKVNDETYLLLNRIRRHATMKTNIDRSFPIRHWTFKEIDKTMRSRWHDFMVDINRVLSQLPSTPFSLDKISDFRVLANSPDIGIPVLDFMIENRDRKCIFFPIFIAGESNMSSLDEGWFLKWFFSNWKDLYKKMEYEFVLFFLPQVYSLIVNESKNNMEHMFIFRGIVNSLLSYQKKEQTNAK